MIILRLVLLELLYHICVEPQLFSSNTKGVCSALTDMTLEFKDWGHRQCRRAEMGAPTHFLSSRVPTSCVVSRYYEHATPSELVL